MSQHQQHDVEHSRKTRSVEQTIGTTDPDATVVGADLDDDTSTEGVSVRQTIGTVGKGATVVGISRKRGSNRDDL